MLRNILSEKTLLYRASSRQNIGNRGFHIRERVIDGFFRLFIEICKRIESGGITYFRHESEAVIAFVESDLARI